MNDLVLKALLQRRTMVLQDIWKGEGVVTRLHQDLIHIEAVIRMVAPEWKFGDEILEIDEGDEPVAGIEPHLPDCLSIRRVIGFTDPFIPLDSCFTP